ncbi:MAG: DUF3108 domain-containing protein [Paracoccaceae bacterium]
MLCPRLHPAILLTAALAALAATPLRAEQAAVQNDRIVFDISIKGLSAARLTIGGSVNASTYVAKGTLKSAGLLAFVKKVRYDAETSGHFAAGRFTPARYSEKADTGKRQSEAVMAYVGGVPQVKSYNPPKKARAQALDPATQGGTVDPLTALFAILRAVPRDAACDQVLTLFDGRRRSQVTLGPAKTAGDAISCDGEYRRLEGFSAKDMAEKARFPFQLTYGPAAGEAMVQVTEISMDTLYGNGRMIRQ